MEQKQSLVDISEKLFNRGTDFNIVKSYIENHLPEHYDIIGEHLEFVETKLSQLYQVAREKKNISFVFEFRKDNPPDKSNKFPQEKELLVKLALLTKQVEELENEIEDYLTKHKLSLLN